MERIVSTCLLNFFLKLQFGHASMFLYALCSLHLCSSLACFFNVILVVGIWGLGLRLWVQDIVVAHGQNLF